MSLDRKYYGRAINTWAIEYKLPDLHPYRCIVLLFSNPLASRFYFNLVLSPDFNPDWR
jgi:hypothetical protein